MVSTNLPQTNTNTRPSLLHRCLRLKLLSRSYYSSLDQPSQKEYLEDIDTKMRCANSMLQARVEKHIHIEPCSSFNCCIVGYTRSGLFGVVHFLILPNALGRYFMYAASHSKDGEKKKRCRIIRKCECSCQYHNPHSHVIGDTQGESRDQRDGVLFWHDPT